ncbi:hypothetical protein M422DRAFT_255105 [Sphaerobolus stellatus SS14]|uniref:Uncharacterized protein n=1 Tax=Sphaerobolus stellatus (strain SS14) TaxID=990650 RepID=A0A0C9VU98_SPHS4|nr:hypothetical protein M422DRAFT_255105 [Sphaerobolus stellatus SS14]
MSSDMQIVHKMPPTQPASQVRHYPRLRFIANRVCQCHKLHTDLLHRIKTLESALSKAEGQAVLLGGIKRLEARLSKAEQDIPAASSLAKRFIKLQNLRDEQLEYSFSPRLSDVEAYDYASELSQPGSELQEETLSGLYIPSMHSQMKVTIARDAPGTGKIPGNLQHSS